MTARITVKNPERFRARYGPWAVVTGASSGIGRGMTAPLAAAGVNMVLVARHGDVLDDLATELTRVHGVRTLVVPADLGTPQGVQAVQTATGDLDVGLFIAAAGYGTSGDFLGSGLDAELDMLAVNCSAVLAGTWHFARRFARRGRGGIVLLGSLVGFQGTPRASHYAATKAYIQTLAEGLHHEFRPAGVDVLSCAPGRVRSGFAGRAGMSEGGQRVETVAVATLDALGRAMTVTPGAQSKILTWSLAPLPRSLRVRMMARVMKGLTSHPGGTR